MTQDKLVAHDAKRINVTCLIVRLSWLGFFNNFRSHVSSGTTLIVKQFLFAVGSNTEVDKHPAVILRPVDDVFGFDVTMHYSLLLEVG